jgi:hypothetical protein
VTWAFFGSNSPATGYSLLAEGTDELSHTIGLDQFDVFETISGGADNVLLSQMTAVCAVPEPSTWAMVLLGFAGLGFAFWQSRRKAGSMLELRGTACDK